MLDNTPIVLWLWNGLSGLSPGQIDQAQQLLSSSEKKYLDAIRGESRRLEYIAGHHLIRQVLEHLIPDSAQDITVEHRRNEAPVLHGPNAEHLSFNLSHSGNSICCAMSLDCQVGLDIERPRRRRKYQKIAEAYFSQAEAEKIEKASTAEQAAVFYRAWTLKESFLKARREELSSDNLAVEFRHEVRNTNTLWHCYSFKIEHCYVALCLSRMLIEPLSVQVYDIDTGVSRVIWPQIHRYTPEC